MYTKSQFRSDPETQIFCAKNVGSDGTDLADMTDREIFYDETLWQSVKYIKAHSLNLMEFRNNLGIRFFVNPRSWRLRDNFGFIVKTNDPNAIAIYKKFSDIPKLDQPLRKNHKCEFFFQI